MSINQVIKDFLISQKEYGVASVDIINVFSIPETSKELKYHNSYTTFLKCKKGDYVFVLGFKNVDNTTHEYIKKLNNKMIEVENTEDFTIHYVCKSL